MAAITILDAVLIQQSRSVRNLLPKREKAVA